jgi:BASS family bile acid:Na+ symporter
MPITGVVPQWLLSIVAIATVFTIMFEIGLAIVPGEFRWVGARPWLMLRALFAVLVAVPALAWSLCRVLALPHPAEVGIVLMAISPGAPVALRRSLEAGGHRTFAPALQIAVAALTVVSMPISLAIFDRYYGGDATVAPLELAKQVFIAQLLPLLLGMLAKRLLAAKAKWLEPKLSKIGSALLVLLLVLALVDIWQEVIGAGLRVSLAIVATTVLALAVGHLMGGPYPATRTATAISSAARNAGLALLVVTLNTASTAITRTVLAYLVLAAFTIIPYVIWRRCVATSR